MALDTTPPGSIVEALPTPPRTGEKALSADAQRTLDLFRRHQEGDRPGSWLHSRLGEKDYAQLLRALNANKPLQKYVDAKVRYDFDPGRSCLTFRMPSPLHDTFCAKLVDEISNQLRNFQQGHGPAATFAKKIVHFATSRILIPDDADDGERNYIRREPDASFGHSGAHYPGVIIEVCYSQKRREVSRLADDYILNTDGSVNVVVCLDIDYKQPNKATISVWRPKYVEVDGVVEFRTSPVIDAQDFRTEEGLPVATTALRLSLKDFGTVELTQGRPYLDQEIVVSSEQLCKFLSTAEARQQQEVQLEPQGSVNTLPRGTRKRRRSSTPPDRTDSEDEGALEDRKIESRKSKRGRRDSSDYCPSSPLVTQ